MDPVQKQILFRHWKENKEKLPKEMVEDVEKEIVVAKEKLTSESAEELTAARTALEEKFHKLAAEIYKAAEESKTAGDDSKKDETMPEAEVVDAEFEDDGGSRPNAQFINKV